MFVVDVSAVRGADSGPGGKQSEHHGAVKTFGWITAGSFRLAPPSLLKRQEGTGAGNCVKASLNGKGSEGEKPCVRWWYETRPPGFMRRKPLRTSKRREGKELGEANPGKHKALRRGVYPGS